MGKISRFTLEQFTAFAERTSFDFCPGINVIIGANSTGKTHLMKAIYTTLKVCEETHLRDYRNQEEISLVAKNYFGEVFKPEKEEKVGHLVRHQVGRNSGGIELIYSEARLGIKITTLHKVSVDFLDGAIPLPEKSVFLPVHEFLSIYPGFIAAYQARETSFDRTYYDLAVSLSASPMRGPKLEEIKNLIAPLQKALTGATVSLEDQQFFIKLPEAKLEAPLVSEGYRKIAGLLYLLNNGSLTQNGILFWDEPEANLNPRMVVNVVEALKILAKSGMQIFIATHDYLLSQEMSLLAEYDQDVDIRFFGLYQPGKKMGVKFESGRTLAEIERNPILDEFAAHYDREAQYFENSRK